MSTRKILIRARTFATVALALACVGSAEAALEGRDLDGNPGTFEAYYDPLLNITWLANANLAASNTFGLPTGVSLGTHPMDDSGLVGVIFPAGQMNWPGALHWIDAMNADGGTGYFGFSDWRLPTVTPINGVSLNTSFSNNAATDLGYAGSDGWVDMSGNPTSEMGHLFYVTLGNLGFCTPDDADPTGCVQQAGWGLANTGPFMNIDGNCCWTDVPLSASDAIAFSFGNGAQFSRDKGDTIFGWAVRSGDVAVIPVPAALPLFLSAIAGLLLGGRRTLRR